MNKGIMAGLMLSAMLLVGCGGGSRSLWNPLSWVAPEVAPAETNPTTGHQLQWAMYPLAGTAGILLLAGVIMFLVNGKREAMQSIGLGVLLCVINAMILTKITELWWMLVATAVVALAWLGFEFYRNRKKNQCPPCNLPESLPTSDGSASASRLGSFSAPSS